MSLSKYIYLSRRNSRDGWSQFATGRPHMYIYIFIYLFYIYQHYISMYLSISRYLSIYLYVYLGEILEMAGHSVPLAGLGGFILIFGFLAFNGGSQVDIRLLQSHILGRYFRPSFHIHSCGISIGRLPTQKYSEFYKQMCQLFWGIHHLLFFLQKIYASLSLYFAI